MPVRASSQAASTGAYNAYAHGAGGPVTAFFTGQPVNGNTRVLVEDLRLGGLAFGQRHGRNRFHPRNRLGPAGSCLARSRGSMEKPDAPEICPRRRAIMISPRQPFG
ncbi:hypothetical protein EB231_10935 [Mesorhizobium sp. NZP2298]|nr:hypothetical protein EB231_10935 [Mesorhizobium sp. NZP2298]